MADDAGLGMGAPIARRDFLDGLALTLGGAALAGSPAFARTDPGADYPPMRQGMRGFTDEEMNAGHSVRDGLVNDGGDETGEVYDLIVVGAGMAGLSAAWFYKKHIPNAKILLLEGCDDFGGHARRVEFNVDGRQLLSNGGTVALWYPNTFSPEAKQMLAEIGVDRERYYRQADAFATATPKSTLGRGRFFAKEEFGRDKLITNWPTFAEPDPAVWRAVLDTTPWPEDVKAGYIKYYTDTTDYMAGLSLEEKVARLRKMTYVDYLANVAKIHPAVVSAILLQGGSEDSNMAAGPDTFSAWFAFRTGRHGFRGLGFSDQESVTDLTKEPGRHIYFPDGNAGVARLLVRALIPSALPGKTMEDSVPAHVRYDQLDRPEHDVRLRLSSMAVGVKHLGEPGAAQQVEVRYVKDDKLQRVRAGGTVLACFHTIIPHIAPELPEAQKEALRFAVRKPNVYTRVAIRNSRAFHKLGVSRIYTREMFYQMITLQPRPHSAPSAWSETWQSPMGPDDPTVLDMDLSNEMLEMHGSGLPPRDQWRAARAKLQEISFETMERNIRSQLNRVLGPGGFDAKRDIAGITVSRWSHGYATGTNELYDPDWTHRDDAPWIVARQRFGRIAIGSTDSAAVALTNAAIAQGHRAAMELVNDIVRPTYDFSFSERDTMGPMGTSPKD